MDENTITQILYIILAVMIFLLIVLSLVYLILRMKGKNKEEKEDTILSDVNKKGNKEKNKNANTVTNMYTKQSIFDFMDFDKIEDNMIVQKKGKRYLMVVECQGVNYDLMSQMEKVAVEEGFQQFLNTLRHPIQIYIQTRTVNLEKGINTYKQKIKEIENKHNQMFYEYNTMKQSDAYSEEELEKYFFEITKQRNLLEYGKDIVQNTEKISLNQSVLNKKYYVIISYYSEETTNDKFDVNEIRNIAFSELYTKSQAVIRTLSSCSISGKILSSEELLDLLYVSYNRDESEVFGIDKAYRSNFEELYVTAPDVYEKKIRALDEEIKNQAIDLANSAIEKAKSKKQQIAADKEDNLDELINKMASIILEENKQYVGEEIAEQAIEEIKEKDSEEKEGGIGNEKSKKTTTRGRKKKTATT